MQTHSTYTSQFHKSVIPVLNLLSVSVSMVQVYNGVAGPFVMPPFATAGTPLYNVAGLRPVKMEGTDW